METQQVVKIGFRTAQDVPEEERMNFFLGNRAFSAGQLTRALGEYLVIYTKTFKDGHFLFTGDFLENSGNCTGLIGYLRCSKIDVAPQPISMFDNMLEVADFGYPYQLYHSTFMIRKPEYKPEIFGIFKTVSFSVWISVFAVSFFMCLSSYVMMKKKHAFHKILLHVFAVFLRQGSLLKASSVAENLVIYSWVVGAMLLCLAYDSVFLSFLAIPPVLEIKNIEQLAAAVQNRKYECIALPVTSTYALLTTSEEENYRIIGDNLRKNRLEMDMHVVLDDFLYDRNKQNLAFLLEEQLTDHMNMGKKFISEDRILGTMTGMMIRKGFCCKKLLETFVHRYMASGLYCKIQNDASFFQKFLHSGLYTARDTVNRKLTLTDVAPAFIFLLTGYFFSFLAFIGEILRNRRKKRIRKEKNKVLEKKIPCN